MGLLQLYAALSTIILLKEKLNPTSYPRNCHTSTHSLFSNHYKEAGRAEVRELLQDTFSIIELIGLPGRG